MRLLAKILPYSTLSARISGSTMNRRYTSLIQIIPQKNYLVYNSLGQKRTYGCHEKSKELIKRENSFLKITQKVTISPVALTHSNPVNNSTFRLFLIPLDWLRTNEQSMRSTVTSILSKAQNLQKIDKLNPDIKNEAYREKETRHRKSTQTGLAQSQLVKCKNFKNSNAGQYKPENVDYLNVLTDAANKFLNQIFVTKRNTTVISITKKENNSILALNLSPHKERKIAWSKSMPFTEAKSFLTNTFPLTLSKKSLSTCTSALMLTTFSDRKLYNSQMLNIPTQILAQGVNPIIKRPESSNSFRCKTNPNYDFPYLSKLFETESFLMRSDAYNQALAEATKRRAALIELKALSKKLCLRHSIQRKLADGGCKKDGPSDPCEGQNEKIENIQGNTDKQKRNKMPTGCVSPKCKKGDKCDQNPNKSPCKKATSTSQVQLNASSFNFKRPSNEELIKAVIKTNPDCLCSYCKKDGGGKGKGGSTKDGKPKPKTKKDTCKDDDSEYKPKCNPDPCKGDSAPCVQKKAAPCKKSNTSGDKKNDPCKKKDSSGSKKEAYDPCKKKDPCGNKKKEDSSKKKDPCGDKKKKKDPCKTKHPSSDKKKNDPCGGKKKEDSKKNKDPCKSEKKEDPCKKKRGSSKSCASKQEDVDQKDEAICDKVIKDTKPNCPKNKNETKSCASRQQDRVFGDKVIKDIRPNCQKNEKETNSDRCKRKSATLPSIKNRNLYSFGFMRNYSSQKNKKRSKNGKNSQCKTVQTHVPAQRKNITYPYPKNGLRQCYPIYDMDCTKYCRDPRKTACKKYTFLKDTEDKKRQNNK